MIYRLLNIYIYIYCHLEGKCHVKRYKNNIYVFLKPCFIIRYKKDKYTYIYYTCNIFIYIIHVIYLYIVQDCVDIFLYPWIFCSVAFIPSSYAHSWTSAGSPSSGDRGCLGASPCRCWLCPPHQRGFAPASLVGPPQERVAGSY